MTTTRLFKSADFCQPSDNEPIRTVLSESEHAVIVAWYVKAWQKIPAHCHPHGQDTWTVLSGTGEYCLDADTHQKINAGDVVIAYSGQMHGVFNPGEEPLMFISVVSPNAGYQLLET
jgi:quercetin dioxygenase-like cupin family protein